MKPSLRVFLTLLCFPLLFGFCAHAQQPSPAPSTDQADSLEIASISPPSPAVLKVGEKIQVTVRYRLASSEEARIFVSPSTRVRLQRGVCSTQSASVSRKGNGELAVSFYMKEPSIVDGVQVRMVDVKARKTIKSASLPIHAEWQAEGAQTAAPTPTTPASADQADSLEIVSIQPPSPAVLKVGEKIQVTVRYRLNSCKEVRISVSPSAKGRIQRGIFSDRSASVSHKGNGELAVSVCLNEPARVNEIQVRMLDVKARKFIKSASIPIQAEWRAEGAQTAVLTPEAPKPPDSQDRPRKATPRRQENTGPTPESPVSKDRPPTTPMRQAETGPTPEPPDVHDRLPTEPILRIETGMHLGSAAHMNTDVAKRFLLTGSFDGTVRLWLLATGELLRVFRPPYAPTTKSKILCCAISSDGNTIACAKNYLKGEDPDKDGYSIIYFFNRLTGRVVSVIKVFDYYIRDMSFSKDGHYFAVATPKQGGEVFRAPQYAEVAIIEKGQYIKTVDFSADGRLVTVTREFVRLYDAGFKLIAQQHASEGENLNSAVFSPDGSKIAVRCDGGLPKRGKPHPPHKVKFLSARDLTLLNERHMQGSYFDYKVIFSDDGTQLIPSRNYKSIAADRNRMSEICLNERQFPVGWTDRTDDLLVSQDGTRVKFKDSAVFSVRARQFEGESVGLLELRLSAPGFPVSRSNGLLTINGKHLVSPGNTVRDSKFGYAYYTVSPNEDSLLASNSYYLGLFDRKGEKKWERRLQYGCGGVLNVAGNGQVAVVWISDQTIRWYRMSDGQELLALFQHPDGKRWVLWTPSGYYDCSPGAEDLIGWHINNGEDKAADFYPVSRFRSRFYRPDVVAKMLDTRDEAEALRQADAEANRKKTETVSIEKILPPTVAILSPQIEDTVTTEEIEVRYTTHAPQDAPVTSVTVKVDGRPLEGNRGVKLVSAAATDGQTIRVPIPHRDCVVSLLAENRHGVGEAAYVRLKWGGTAQSAAKPKLYALVVGVSAYAAAELQLRYAAKDAGDFGTVLDKQKGGLYREVEMKLLTDKQAMRDEVLSGLKWLSQHTTPNDVAVLFLAGHGVNDTDGSYYYLPANAAIAKLSQTGVRFSEIREVLAKITGKALFFVDTCHAGAVLGNRRSVEDLTRLMNESSSAENGVVVFASSTSQQSSLEKDEWHNGAFTKALVEGFCGEAASKVTGLITVKSLDSWVSDKVEQLTGGKQTPSTVMPAGTFDFKNFPVAVPLDKVGTNR